MSRSANKAWVLVEPVVEGLGYELVGVEFGQHGGQSVLRIYIDKPDGLTVEDCERVSKQVSALLDVEDPISGAYDLEVSSPGLDRPLFRLRDFERFSGEQIKVRLFDNVNGRRNFKGLLLGVQDGHVVIKVDEDEFKLEFEQIDKAKLVPQF
ncbi:MAG: ribosome maturation factor RimP [Gammaproteobacteria bacterium]|nr:ribosome maturation factor RimP [Gammaproteobacteria bacterium]